MYRQTLGRANKAAVKIIDALLWFYQKAISPWFLPRCRYAPSCSEFAREAFTVHGFIRGGWLTLKRLLRCHPLGSSGYDPVPKPNKREP